MHQRLVLNLAGGKHIPSITNVRGFSNDDKIFLLNVDRMYQNTLYIGEVELQYDAWSQGNMNSETYFLNDEIKYFMDSTILKFDHVILYRYLEHISLSEMNYFLYSLSTLMKVGSCVDVIVPNARVLARMLLEESVSSPDFGPQDILLTTEFCNEPADPHASLWTPERANYYMTYENRFEIINMDEQFIFDGRNIYMRFLAKRIN